jgi:hypothetical protein
LFVGDRIVVAYGNRYAPDQFEGVVPGDLGEVDLLAAGGVAGRVVASHAKMAPATRLAPVGLLHDADGRRINVRDHAISPVLDAGRPASIAVVGTSMNSGKTTTTARLVRGLRAAGLRVGAAKVTGTGAGGDPWLMRDAGAHVVYDFTDAGVASTSLLDLPALQEIVDTLLSNLAAAGAEVAVFEVADGLLQPETAALVTSPKFARSVDGVIFVAGEAMGAAHGVQWLHAHGLPVVAVSGVLTSAPLAIREAQAATQLPVLTGDELATGEIAERLVSKDYQPIAA